MLEDWQLIKKATSSEMEIWFKNTAKEGRAGKDDFFFSMYTKKRYIGYCCFDDEVDYCMSCTHTHPALSIHFLTLFLPHPSPLLFSLLLLLIWRKTIRLRVNIILELRRCGRGTRDKFPDRFYESLKNCNHTLTILKTQNFVHFVWKILESMDGLFVYQYTKHCYIE